MVKNPKYQRNIGSVTAKKKQAYLYGWWRGKLPWSKKIPPKNIFHNYRPITSLLMMWKILTAQIKKEIYWLIESRRHFTEENTGCRKRIRGNRWLIIYTSAQTGQNKAANVAMEWINKKKTMLWVGKTSIRKGPKSSKYLIQIRTSRIQWKPGKMN